MKTFLLMLILSAVTVLAQDTSENLEVLPESDDHTAPVGMAYIPGGEFSMGREGSLDASPVHEVEIAAFYIDLHETTNAEYRVFCDSSGHRLPEFWGSEKYRCGEKYPSYPVIGVSRSDAQAYAKWKGKRLPSEAEWEFAARGGRSNGVYPSGPELLDQDANYGRTAGLKSVGSCVPNAYGLYDMAGNVWEWTADFYGSTYYSESPRENPEGPSRGKLAVIRGGSWHSGPGCVRVDYRGALSPGWLDFAVGFRCVRDIVPEE